MDDLSEELRHRRAKFLKVEKSDDAYRETSTKGETTTYRPVDISRHEITIEATYFHTIVDPSSGETRYKITGQTDEEFRAIGTEGFYKSFNVEISDEVEQGRIILSNTYEKDGHDLLWSVRIGMSAAAINALSLAKNYKIRLQGLSGVSIYDSSTGRIILSYWQEHVQSEQDSENIKAVWHIAYSRITASPRGYHPILSMPPTEAKEIFVMNPVRFHFKDGFEETFIEALAKITSGRASLSEGLRYYRSACLSSLGYWGHYA